MKAEFLRAAHFEHKGETLRFSVGVHDVPPQVLHHPYFKMLLKDGMILEPGPDKAKAQAQAERHQAMVAKVEALPEEQVPVSEAKVSEILEDVKKEKKKSKK